MDTRDRPRSNDSLKLGGVRQKKRDSRKATPRDKMEKARKALEREILKNADPGLRSAYKRFREGITSSVLMGILGMEYLRLSRSLGEEGTPDYRYNAAMQKLLDQIRRTLAMDQEQESFIPDRVHLTIERPEGLVDVSDEPEFE